MSKIKFSLCLIIALLTFSASAEYFYMDKTYSDILVNNPIKASLTMVDAKDIPQELQLFAFTSIKTNSAIPKSNFTQTLIPSEVLLFMGTGDFDFIWMTGPSKADKLSGKWKVENSQLIFTLTDKSHSSVYAPNSQMRYEIVKIGNVANTKLTLKRCTYPSVTNIIPTSDSPIYDFERLASLVTAKNKK